MGRLGNQLKSVYVAGLSPSCSEDELREIFSRYGSVQHVRIQKDPATNYPLGYAFVRMSSTSEALLARLSVDNQVIGGRTVRVREAMHKASPIVPGGIMERRFLSIDYFARIPESEACMQVVRVLFARFGAVRNILNVFHSVDQGNYSRGSCYVEFMESTLPHRLLQRHKNMENNGVILILKEVVDRLPFDPPTLVSPPSMPVRTMDTYPTKGSANWCGETPLYEALFSTADATSVHRNGLGCGFVPHNYTTNALTSYSSFDTLDEVHSAAFGSHSPPVNERISGDFPMRLSSESASEGSLFAGTASIATTDSMMHWSVDCMISDTEINQPFVSGNLLQRMQELAKSNLHLEKWM